MKVNLLKHWDSLRSSFWFLPALMAGGSVALPYGTVALDEAMPGPWLNALAWVHKGGADGATAVLQTITASIEVHSRFTETA